MQFDRSNCDGLRHELGVFNKRLTDDGMPVIQPGVYLLNLAAKIGSFLPATPRVTIFVDLSPLRLVLVHGLSV
jgi:hypothetical protein